jgi:hypothetical protein
MTADSSCQQHKKVLTNGSQRVATLTNERTAMKRLIIAGVLTAGLIAHAQERLSREESLKYAFFAASNLKEMLSTPIATDPDIKRPVGYKDGDYGALLLPETKLAEGLAKVGSNAVPIGQIWMAKLAPMSEGQVVPDEKLKKVHVTAGGDEADVVVCALAVVKEEGKAQLLVFGKAKEPVLKVPLKATSAQQDNPLDFTAERENDAGLLTVRIGGKYEGSFRVTDPSQN